MPDESTELTQLSDEELWEQSVKLRDWLNDPERDDAEKALAKNELKDVEIERGMRRAAGYPDGHPKQLAALAGIEKLRKEGFSDEVQKVAL